MPILKGHTLYQKLVSEFLGSLFLVMAAISPIILFNDVLGAPIEVAIVADALAVGFILFALIEIFAPIGGAHFNPAVTFSMMVLGRMKPRTGLAYGAAQVLGGITGMLFSHLMFYHEIPIVAEVSEVNRSGGNYFAEVLGTFFLVLAILLLIDNRSKRLSLVIGLLVGGMLMATSSTMFANPQVTIARVFTYSAAGLRPLDAVVFLVMEVIGALLAAGTYLFLKARSARSRSKEVV